jgi:LEA14-like dessication related protein
MKINLLRRAFFLFLIFAAFIAGYFYFNKALPIEFKGCTTMSIAKVTAEASELRGEMIFHNPNSMRAQIGKLNVTVRLDGSEIGILHETFKTTIKGNEDLNYPFQFRFPVSTLPADSAGHDLSVTITGEGGSDVLFANYTFPISYSAIVKNTIR